MSSILGRPTLAAWTSVTAGAAWITLVVVNGMLLTSDRPFIGNPLYTALIGIAVTSTVSAIQLHCHRAAVRVQIRLSHPSGRRQTDDMQPGHLRAVPAPEVMPQDNEAAFEQGVRFGLAAAPDGAKVLPMRADR